MNISDKGIAIIKKYEGLSLKPYLCPAGKWTIGWGHVMSSLERVTFAKGITLQKAEQLLAADTGKALKRLLELVPLGYLNQNQTDAVVSFMFNVGNQAFETSTMRKLILEKKLKLASTQFDRWVLATDPKTGKKVRLEGLVRRRAEEKKLFLA